MIRKIIKCQRGESSFPWFFILVGIPVLISILGNDDEDKKDTDTSKKVVLEEKTRKTDLKEKTNKLIEDARDEYKEAKKVAVEKIDTSKKDYKKEFVKEKERKLDNPDPFADGDDKFQFNEKLF